MKLFNDLLKDGSAKYSLSKCILFLGFWIASAVLIKMAVLHEPEVSASFISYLAFISGHASLNKFLDKKKDENKP